LVSQENIINMIAEHNLSIESRKKNSWISKHPTSEFM